LYKGPIKAIIKSITRLVRHANPGYVTFWCQKWDWIDRLLDWRLHRLVIYRHIMEIEQMIFRLLAEMKAMQEKMDASQKEI
jgi:hypothetical protein